MRGNFNSIALLPSYRRKLPPHPACGHLPPQGEGSPQKASPPGRSCRPQAADEGGVRAVSLLTGSTRRLSPHPACGHLPPEGEGSPQKASPFGRSCRPQAADEGGVRAVTLLTGSTLRLSPHPACGHLPTQGEGSPQKAFPPGRSCRPQAADEGGVRAVSLLTGNTRRLSPHPSTGGAADTFSPRGGRLLVIYLLAHAEGFKHFINRCLCRALAGQVAQRLQGFCQADGGCVQPKAVLPCADGFGQRITRAGRG